jgi:hypothetical protein
VSIALPSPCCMDGGAGTDSAAAGHFTWASSSFGAAVSESDGLAPSSTTRPDRRPICACCLTISGLIEQNRRREVTSQSEPDFLDQRAFRNSCLV